jgi:dihydropteroate synthase
MGVINVTPDSFSDGGVHFDAPAAIAAGRGMLEDGAAIVDVGGQSTRPGSSSISTDEELARVVPVLEGLSGAPISIDTSNAAVARRAIELGAEMVNDVTALRADPELVGVLADGETYACLMHMQGVPETMQVAPRYDDVVSDVAAFLEERLVFAVEHGVREELICLDPGVGFGKTPDQNLELVNRLDEISSLGRPVLIGFSRKSTLARVVGDATGSVGTDSASVGAAVAAFDRGASIFRVHHVRSHVEALTAAAAVERAAIA